MSVFRQARLAFLCAALVGCARAQARFPGADSTRVSSPTITLRGPTLVAFYPAAARSRADSNDLAEVLDDFSYHLSTASDSLKALGFDVVMRRVDSVLFQQGERITTFRPPHDSAEVGFYFVAPNKQPMLLYGVASGGELIATARRFLQR